MYFFHLLFLDLTLPVCAFCCFVLFFFNQHEVFRSRTLHPLGTWSRPRRSRFTAEKFGKSASRHNYCHSMLFPPFHPHFNYILNNFIKVVRIEKVVLTHRRINRLHSFYLIYNCLYCSYSFSSFYFINISSVRYSCHHCQQLRGTFKRFPHFLTFNSHSFEKKWPHFST